MVARVAVRGHGRKAGEHEVVAGAVYLIEDGRWAGVDFYDPDDRLAMIARYVELGGGLGKLGDTAPERLFAEFARRFAARDLGAVLELMSDDYVQVDHRQMGWNELDKQQNAREFQSVWKGTTDCRAEVDDVLAAGDRVFLAICAYRGSADAATGGGQFEYPVGFLLVADGKLCSRVEWFDPEDRKAMLARYRELAAEG